MSRRTKAILLIVISVILLAVLIFFMIRSLTPEDVFSDEAAQNTDQTQDVPLVNTSLVVADVQTDGEQTVIGSPEQASLQTELSRMAAMFTERFGTYSNQGELSNISDLSVLMTPNLTSWAFEYFEDIKESLAREPQYFGITTRSISVKTNRLDTESGVAEFTVISQRSEVAGTTAPVIRYQNLILKMIADGTTWKVDFVKWE